MRTITVCKTCVAIHGRDTNAPIQCPKCYRIIGCFWHDRNLKHIRNCKNILIKQDSEGK